ASWEMWKIRVLDSFETYKLARRGLQKSVDTSDIGCTDIDVASKKARIENSALKE
ncbi:unnamed protein product, partial [Allacma fusca]